MRWVDSDTRAGTGRDVDEGVGVGVLVEWVGEG